MLTIGYAFTNGEKISEKEAKSRQQAVPVYLLTKTGCGWIQHGVDEFQKHMIDEFGINNIVVISGTDLLDKEKLITKLKETPDAYMVLSDKTSPVIIPQDIPKVIDYLEYNADSHQTTWELLLNKHRQEYPVA